MQEDLDRLIAEKYDHPIVLFYTMSQSDS